MSILNKLKQNFESGLQFVDPCSTTKKLFKKFKNWLFVCVLYHYLYAFFLKKLFFFSIAKTKFFGILKKKNTNIFLTKF